MANIGTQLFNELLAAFGKNAAEVIALYADDAIIEYPYAASFGMPARLDKAEYEKHLKSGLEQMPDLKFSNIRVYQTVDPNQYWAEAHGETVIARTGKLYEQDYVMFFRVENGKFSFYREYWNAMPVLDAFGNADDVQTSFSRNQD